MKTKRIIAVLIALALTLSLLPMTVFAADAVVVMTEDDFIAAYNAKAPSIKLGANITVKQGMPAFNTVIDLAGFVLTFDGVYGDADPDIPAIIATKGESNITIKDSSTEKTGLILCPKSGFYWVAGEGKGTLNIESGEINVTYTGPTYYNRLIYIENGDATINISGGVFYAPDLGDKIIYTEDDENLVKAPTINITGGTFNGELTIYAGNTTISGGTFKDEVYLDEGNKEELPLTAIINGGTFEDYFEVYGGNVTFNGGTFKAGLEIYNEYNLCADNKVIINGGTFLDYFTHCGAVYTENEGYGTVYPLSLIINGGTFGTAEEEIDDLYLCGKATINGGTVNGQIWIDNFYSDTDVTINDCTVVSTLEPALELYSSDNEEEFVFKCKVNGGSFTGLTAGILLFNTSKQMDPENVQILGGTFTATEPEDKETDDRFGGIVVSFMTDTLGTANPETYIPTGYYAYTTDGKYEVVPFDASLNFTNFLSESPLTPADKTLIEGQPIFAIRSKLLSTVVGKAEYDVKADADSATKSDIKIDAAKVAPGKTAAFTITPKAGYELKSVIVKDAAGNEIKATLADGKYSFTMPLSDATIYATFSGGDVIADTNDANALLPFAALMMISAAGAVVVLPRKIKRF